MLDVISLIVVTLGIFMFIIGKRKNVKFVTYLGLLVFCISLVYIVFQLFKGFGIEIAGEVTI